jgi:TonB-dependent starch-binding outer membrane protein SusC
MKKKLQNLIPLSKPGIKKLLLTMKLSLIIVFLSVMQVSANLYSQVAVNLDVQDKSICDVLKIIEQQSQVRFFYSDDLLVMNELVDVKADNKNIIGVLDDIFSKSPLTYKAYEDNLIVIVPRELLQQQKQVTGIVSDKNGPIVGANVVVTGTTTGTITDFDGKYSISLPQGAQSLTFTFIGMLPQEISIGTLTQIDVTMAEDAIGLDEVVVVGYGTAKKATITGSVASVDGEKLQLAKSANFTNSLVGRLPGLVAVTRSGLPGEDNATIRIRGNNTLNNNSPLIVVDGIANRSMSRLDAADIESVIVLKDASAAIYGAQAANGVILVTTKRGKSGKLKVSATFNQGFSSPTVLPDMASSYLYATMMNEVDLYAGQSQRFAETDLQLYKDGSDPWGHPNTDWFDEVFKPFSLQNDANINFSGGTESLAYYISVGKKFQDATYRKSGANYSQVDFRTNFDAKISDNIKVSFDLAGRQEDRLGTVSSTSQNFRIIPRGKPTDVAWWHTGQPGPDVESDDNPVVMVSDIPGYNRQKDYVMESNLKLDINIPWVDGLSFTGNASVDKNFGNDKMWQVPYNLYVWDGMTTGTDGLPVLSGSKRGISAPRLDQSMADGQQITLNALINYEKKIGGNHKIKLLAGSETSKGEDMMFSALRKYYISNSISELFAGSNLEKDNFGSSSENARLNFFGRANYDYLSKYLVEFVFRYDGSYRFPADQRWGFFPGVSAGWVLSEENFWKDNIAFLDFFKLRGSWGQTGNDRIAAFQYLSTYGFGDPTVLNRYDGSIFALYGGQLNKIFDENSIPNVNVTWEVANQTDIGFDARMLGGRLRLEGDYFYNLRTNILTQRNASVPASAGLTLPPENIGEVVNQGFEFMISYSGDPVGDFGYTVSLNGGYAKNKIKFWDETPGIPDYQLTTGHPMNSQLYYQAIGIFKDQAAVDAVPHWGGARPGDIIYEDINGDGNINGLDMVRDYRSNIPTFTTGFNLDLTYKNFYASVLLQGAFGGMRYHYVEGGVAGNYYTEDTEGRWTPDNTDATKPRAFNYVDEYWRDNNSGRNTYWLRSNDYVRLKNLEVGYNMPKSVNDRLGIDGLRMYVGGTNLVTWSPDLKSFDPESTSQDYPLHKVITLGASINF